MAETDKDKDKDKETDKGSTDKLEVVEYYKTTSEEFACHHCGTFPPTGIDTSLVYLVNCMCTVVGEKLNINSGYRCPTHNAAEGGASNSQHVLGTASDLHRPEGWSIEQLGRLARKYGATAMGGYPDEEGNFIHVDVREGLRPGDGPTENFVWGSFPTTYETSEAEQKLQNAKGGGKVVPRSATSAPASTGANTFGFSKSGNLTIKVKPDNKTFCEPIYPDLLSLPGNIPDSTIDAGAAISNASGVSTGMEYVVSAQDNATLSGLPISSFVNSENLANRQKSYDPEKDIYSFKIPNAGLPLNCCDPYPVDLKIEELEMHTPRVKQYEISLSKPDGNVVTVAEKLLQVADYTEKRIVKLENILSTVMRYVFAMGRRMSVNCIYYGGQDKNGGKILNLL